MNNDDFQKFWVYVHGQRVIFKKKRASRFLCVADDVFLLFSVISVKRIHAERERERYSSSNVKANTSSWTRTRNTRIGSAISLLLLLLCVKSCCDQSWFFFLNSRMITNRGATCAHYAEQFTQIKICRLRVGMTFFRFYSTHTHTHRWLMMSPMNISCIKCEIVSHN